MDNNDFYRYVRGSKSPSKQELLFKPQALTAPANALATLPAAPVQAQQVAPLPYVQGASAVPTQPRALSSAPSTAPAVGSKTGRVWDIANNLYEQAAVPVDFKTLRRAIISACEAIGTNENTASVQYSKWRKTKP